MRCLVLVLLIAKVITAAGYRYPIVLWHGMGDSCCWSFSLGGFKAFLEKSMPGTYILSLEIGSNTIEDMENGYFMNPNKQVEYVCKLLASDPKLKGGFNAIGFSQGSQFLRAVVQRCGHTLPRVVNLISLGGQHQGVYGLPNCAAMDHVTCDYMRKILNYAAYTSALQHTLVQATYWHDPLDEEKYIQHSIFLADINNERYLNHTYKENLTLLEHLVLVLFEDDTVVQPRETEWFGFYAPGQDVKIVNLKDSKIYIENRLGLQQMNEEGKLIFLSCPGNHLRFSEEWFINKIMYPYLM